MVLQLPAPKNALHLYRHLLREASYLPPVARPHLTKRIVDMFRRNRNDPEPKTRIRKATRQLRILRAAVAGHPIWLENVIHAAFGRRGFRRRQLFTEFASREPPSDSVALQELVDWEAGFGPVPKNLMKYRALQRQEKLARDWLDGWDTDKLLALLKIQARQPDIPKVLSVKSQKFDPYSPVPELNSSGLPFPPKPARTKVKKWWASIADKVLPPIPREEWEMLRDLAQGKTMAGGQVLPRRPVALGSEDTEMALALAKQSWDMENYLLQPTCWVDRKSSRKRVLLTGLKQPNDELGLASGAKTSKITPRALRRLYGRVWQLSPLVEKKDGPVPAWNIQFGQPDRTRETVVLETWVQVFQGVDPKGFPKQESPRS